MDVCLLWVLCVVRCLCDELITSPEESYQLWCVVVCDLEKQTSWTRRQRPTRGLSRQEKNMHKLQQLLYGRIMYKRNNYLNITAYGVMYNDQIKEGGIMNVARTYMNK
jgi:hypothetical protein